MRQKIRVKRISEVVSPFIKRGEEVLDIGAGTCLIAEEIQKNNKVKITCTDIKDYNKTNLPLTICRANELPFKGNSFDVALLIYVLHHSDNPQRLLKEAKRVCRGRLIIIEDVYSNRLEYWLLCIIDFLWNVWHSVSCPFYFLKEDEWIHLFSQLGFRTIHKKFFRYPFFDPVIKHILFVLPKNS